VALADPAPARSPAGPPRAGTAAATVEAGPATRANDETGPIEIPSLTGAGARPPAPPSELPELPKRRRGETLARAPRLAAGGGPPRLGSSPAALAQPARPRPATAQPDPPVPSAPSAPGDPGARFGAFRRAVLGQPTSEPTASEPDDEAVSAAPTPAAITPAAPAAPATPAAPAVPAATAPALTPAAATPAAPAAPATPAAPAVPAAPAPALTPAAATPAAPAAPATPVEERDGGSTPPAERGSSPR
jgi:hypothetical protein